LIVKQLTQGTFYHLNIYDFVAQQIARNFNVYPACKKCCSNISQ